MKATGIVRRIDDLGRVVIPKEIRRTMRIREGDPLEIYTDREGEVIFKKYSPIGELASFAAQYAETLYKSCNMSVIITDRDAVIACAGVSKKEYNDKQLSDAVENIIESRNIYVWREGGEKLPVISDGGKHFVSCAMPIISEGDVLGDMTISAKIMINLGITQGKDVFTLDVSYDIGNIRATNGYSVDEEEYEQSMEIEFAMKAETLTRHTITGALEMVSAAEEIAAEISGVIYLDSAPSFPTEIPEIIQDYMN